MSILVCALRIRASPASIAKADCTVCAGEIWRLGSDQIRIGSSRANTFGFQQDRETRACPGTSRTWTPGSLGEARCSVKVVSKELSCNGPLTFSLLFRCEG